MLSKAGEIRRDEACLDYSGNDVVLYPCHGSKGNQVFEKTPYLNKLCDHYFLIFIALVLRPKYEAYSTRFI